MHRATGLDVENGLHEFIRDDPELAALAARHGVELRDLRRPPAGLDVPDRREPRGARRRIVLTVGSDCAIGKMTVALELDRAARRAASRSSSSRPGRPGSRSRAGGSPSTPSSPTSSRARPSGSSSRATSAGESCCSSRVRARCSHPAYSGVTLGLLHGSAPHAFVLCHLAGATEVEGYPGASAAVAGRARRAARARLAARARRAPVACVALNTRHARRRRRRAGGDRARRGRRRGCPPTIPCASGPIACSTRSSTRSANLRRRSWAIGAAAVGANEGKRSDRARCGLAAIAAALVCAGGAAADIGVNDDSAKYGARRWVVLLRGEGGRAAAGGDQRPLPAARPDDDPGQALRRPGRRRRGAAGRDDRLRRLSVPARRVRGSACDSARIRALRRPSWRARYPMVRQFVIGNEPNQPAFLRPQFRPRAQLLGRPDRRAPRLGLRRARSSSILRSRVVGVGLSPRGNDNPAAKSNRLDVAGPLHPRRSDAGIAPAAGAGRSMDGFSFHPYPNAPYRPARARLRVAERGLREPRPDQAGALGRVRGHRPADDRGRVSGCTWTRSAGRSTRAAGGVHGQGERRRHDRGGARRSSTPRSSAAPPATPTSPRSTSSASTTTRSANTAGRQRSTGRTARRSSPPRRCATSSGRSSSAAVPELTVAWTPSAEVAGAWVGRSERTRAGERRVSVSAQEGASVTACLLFAGPDTARRDAAADDAAEERRRSRVRHAADREADPPHEADAPPRSTRRRRSDRRPLRGGGQRRAGGRCSSSR